VTLASARTACVGTGDGSELQLLGGAEVTSEDAAGLPVVMRGEFLQTALGLPSTRRRASIAPAAMDDMP
jgi:lipopolysaccharide export system protein LptC